MLFFIKFAREVVGGCRGAGLAGVGVPVRVRRPGWPKVFVRCRMGAACVRCIMRQRWCEV